MRAYSPMSEMKHLLTLQGIKKKLVWHEEFAFLICIVRGQEKRVNYEWVMLFEHVRHLICAVEWSSIWIYDSIGACTFPPSPLSLLAIKCSWACVATLSHGYHVFDSYNDGIMAGLYAATSRHRIPIDPQPLTDLQCAVSWYCKTVRFL